MNPEERLEENQHKKKSSAIGRKKYGTKRFASMAACSKKK